jgi:ribonuclease HI
MRKLEVYTDGSCVPNPGVGGWGWVVYEDLLSEPKVPIVVSDYGGLKKTTNNQMELTAMAEFLESCPKGIYANIYTDSEYVLGGIVGKNIKTLTRVESTPQGWMRGWCRKLIKNDAPYTEGGYWNKDVKNGYEWYCIHQSLLKHAKSGTILNFCWVKGHSGIEGNEEADRLSNLFREQR